MPSFLLQSYGDDFNCNASFAQENRGRGCGFAGRAGGLERGAQMSNLVAGVQRIKVGAAIPFRGVWEQLLGEWGAVLDRYMAQGQDMNAWVRQQGGDLPYWHEKETTDLGFLAAAVWRLGGVALQEYEVTRLSNKGAADLWFKLQGLSCQIEAKGTDSSSVQPDPCTEALNEARSQLVIPPDERADMEKWGQVLICNNRDVSNGDTSRLCVAYSNRRSG